MQFVRGHGIRRAAQGEQAVRDLQHAVARHHIGQQHHEFVAAGAVHRPQVAHVALQAARHLLQQFISRVMTQRIVDMLEQVQVEEQHGDTVAMVGGVGDGLAQAFVEL